MEWINLKKKNFIQKDIDFFAIYYYIQIIRDLSGISRWHLFTRQSKRVMISILEKGMKEREEALSFDEREIQKHKRKKHMEHKKSEREYDAKSAKRLKSKPKKGKPNHRFTDYDSEDWYD